MKNQFVYIKKYFLLLVLLSFLFANCNQKKKEDGAPVYSAEESLQHFQLADENLEIHLVAAEPYVHAPVAIRFDARGRIWAVEMMDYMPDMDGMDEDDPPSGKIVILEDNDKDGQIDSRKIFMDSLLMPRALCFYDNGLLVAEPPNLWFVEINNDSVGNKYIVDSVYAVGENPEHRPNGLLRGLDNWIYSAKSEMRYRREKGEWVKEQTHFRGQWGITQDDYGRLFYNNNSKNLLGDYFLPGLGAGNPNQYDVSGFDGIIVRNTSTYPIHATPGITHGARPDELDDSLRLKSLTAACGPVIYRSSLLGEDYLGNAFVAGPAANIVKRDILYKDGFEVSGRQAYQNKEFLASDDERFRPVNLYNGPEGALYIVDMYRGIIEYAIYISPYLRDYIHQRKLAKPLNKGRIYKITPKGKNPLPPDLSKKTSEELVHLLNSPDAWVSATAQRLLTDQKKVDAVPLLRDQLQNNILLGKIRAFWTLEGLDTLRDVDIKEFLFSDQIQLQRHAIAAIVAQLDKQNAGEWLQQGMLLLDEKTSPRLAPYLGFLAAGTVAYVPEDSKDFLMKLVLQFPNDPYVADAAISGLPGYEKPFLDKVRERVSDTSLVLIHHLKKVASDAERRKNPRKTGTKFPYGKRYYVSFCKACHGEDGQGIKSLAPPLAGSQWVTGDKEPLMAIVLHGMTGPVKVGDHVYDKSEIAGEMPAFGQVDKLSASSIAHILSYIRSSWSNDAESISGKEVMKFQNKHHDRKKPFTVESLRKLKDDGK